MDRSGIEALGEAMARPVELGGQTYVPDGWRERAHEPKPIEVDTLQGIADYLTANVDGLALDKLMLNVFDPTTVHLFGQLEGEELRFRRRHFLVAKAMLPAMRYDSYLDHESFLIALATRFEETDERAELIGFLRSIRESSVAESNDDGLSQEVKVARGVRLLDNARVPSPVVLAPFRTFTEVLQPSSEFIVRLRGRQVENQKPEIALFEADGGAWRLEAMGHVAEWLRENVKGVAVVA